MFSRKSLEECRQYPQRKSRRWRSTHDRSRRQSRSQYRKHLRWGEHDPHRRANTPLGMWAWLWQRISALLIVVLLVLHILLPYKPLIQFLLLLAVTFHATLGLRVILLDFNLVSVRHHKQARVGPAGRGVDRAVLRLAFDLLSHGRRRPTEKFASSATTRRSAATAISRISSSISRTKRDDDARRAAAHPARAGPDDRVPLRLPRRDVRVVRHGDQRPRAARVQDERRRTSRRARRSRCGR